MIHKDQHLLIDSTAMTVAGKAGDDEIKIQYNITTVLCLELPGVIFFPFTRIKSNINDDVTWDGREHGMGGPGPVKAATYGKEIHKVWVQKIKEMVRGHLEQGESTDDTTG